MQWISVNGKYKAKITQDGYGLELHTMRNGYQWVGQGMNVELLKLTRDVINEYLADKQAGITTTEKEIK